VLKRGFIGRGKIGDCFLVYTSLWEGSIYQSNLCLYSVPIKTMCGNLVHSAMLSFDYSGLSLHTDDWTLHKWNFLELEQNVMNGFCVYEIILYMERLIGTFRPASPNQCLSSFPFWLKTQRGKFSSHDAAFFHVLPCHSMHDSTFRSCCNHHHA